MATKKEADVRIVILQRGWVAVGEYGQVGERCKLTKASVIRIWGTTKGLGEIASGGPNTNTKLDSCPDLEFHELTVIATMKCEAGKWASSLR